MNRHEPYAEQTSNVKEPFAADPLFEKELAQFRPAQNDALLRRILAASDDEVALRPRSRRRSFARARGLLRACALMVAGALIGSALTLILMTHGAPPESPSPITPPKPLPSQAQSSTKSAPVAAVEWSAADRSRDEWDVFPKRRIACRPETSGIPILFADTPVTAKRWRMDH